MPASPILFCSHVVDLGGAESVLLDLLAALDRDRFAPHLALPGDGPLMARAAQLQVPVHQIPIAGRTRLQKAFAVLRASRALRKLAAELDCRVLVANSMIAGYAAVRAQHRNLGCIWHLHIVSESRIARRALRLATAVIAPAQLAIDRIAPIRDASTIPNGVPDRFFETGGNAAPNHGPGGGLRAQLGLSPGTVLIGIVGRLDPLKGHDWLVRALGSVRLEPAPHLVIAGAEVFADSQPRLGGYTESLRRLCRQQGLNERVHWLGQIDDTAPLLAELDLLAVPSVIAECAPRTIAEAQAAGCPVIAADVGGIGAMVRDGQTGLLVQPEEPASLDRAIARLIEAPELRRALARRGQEHAQANYRMAAFTSRCEAVWRRVAAGIGR